MSSIEVTPPKPFPGPYPGLRPFDRHESLLFFGRDEQVDQLLDKLDDSHFLAVLGTSGSGKSSLVRAGLLPALETGYLAGAGACWEVAELRPGDLPLRRLAEALLGDTEWGRGQWHARSNFDFDFDFDSDSDFDFDSGLGSGSGSDSDSGIESGEPGEADAPPASTIDALEQDLRSGNLALNWRLGLRPLREGSRLLILVDQFEELFRYQRGGSEQREQAETFVALLLGAATHPQVYLVITLRSEFLGDCSQYPDLPEAINQGLFLTPSLSPEQMADAIQLPAELALFGGDVEPALVRALLGAARGQSDQLPLLQHALMRLWQDAGPAKKLDEAGLEALGGLRECLDAHVEEAYADLDGGPGAGPGAKSASGSDRRPSPSRQRERQRIAEILFRALTERGSGERDTRRPVPLGEVADLAGVEPEALARVVEVFRRPGRSFLMPPPGVELKRDTVLDITHEALIRQWRCLSAWTADEAGQTELYQRLESAARRHRAKKGSLWIDPDLQIALQWRKKHRPTALWASRYGGDFGQAIEFLEASLAHRDTEQRKREERRRRTVRNARLIALVSVVALILTAWLAAWALSQRKHAVEAKQEAVEQTQLAEVQKGFAERNAEEARLNAGIAELGRIRAEAAEKARTESLFDSGLTHAALLARGEDYAAARQVLRSTLELDGEIPASRRHARNLLAGQVEVMGGSALRVYDEAGAQLSGGVAVSLDGRWLAAAGERGTLVLFDAVSGDLVKRLEGHDPKASRTGDVRSVVFDPEGRWLYSGGDDGRIIRWSVPDGRELARWQAPDRVWALAISPDGALLASGGTDRAITLWSTTSGEPVRTLEGHSGAIAAPNGLDFSTDGKRLASASFDKTARLWDVETGETLHTLEWHNDGVKVTVFSPDGRMLATASADKRVVVWDANTGRPLRLLTGHDNIVFGATFDADGDRLLSASRDNTLRLWDVASGTTLRVYQGHSAGLWAVARHGDELYTAANDQQVRRWSLATPGAWVWELPGEPISTAISPDAALVAVGFADGGLRVYDRAGGGELAAVADAHRRSITRLAFNPSGTRLASASHDDTAALWRVERGDGDVDGEGGGLALTPLHRFEEHSATVYAVAFSPDGHRLATASYDGHVGLYDVESGEGGLFEAHDGEDVNSVSFAETGELLLTQGDWGLRLWDLSQSPPVPRELAQARDMLLWATLRPDGRQLAAVGREYVVTLHDLTATPSASGATPGPTSESGRMRAATPLTLVGHEQTVFRAIYSPDGRQLATVGSDMTVRLWDLETATELFAIQLPDLQQNDGPWDFDFRCTDAGDCWIAVPLTIGRLALYRFPYRQPPPSLLPPTTSDGPAAEGD